MARKNRRINPKEEVVYLQDRYNMQAMSEGPSRKKWSLHDLNTVQPKTPKQQEMFDMFFEGDKNILAYGSAGTGKSFLALFLAFCDVLSADSPRTKVRIVRSIVPTRDIGFLPGTIDEKISVYEQPYIDILEELIGKASTYDDMKKAHLIEFTPTSFIRGSTWDNEIVVIDEAQNMTFPEINSVLTRTGVNTRILITGDLVQTDLTRKSEQSGFSKMVYVTSKMREFGMAEFGINDIVRSDFVKSWIIASEYADNVQQKLN
jgi:phosphate starvation-inducible protein PhoH and related proteins